MNSENQAHLPYDTISLSKSSLPRVARSSIERHPNKKSNLICCVSSNCGDGGVGAVESGWKSTTLRRTHVSK